MTDTTATLPLPKDATDARVGPIRPLYPPARPRPGSVPGYRRRLPLDPSPPDRDVLGGPKRWHLQTRHHLAEFPAGLGASWAPVPPTQTTSLARGAIR